MSCTLVTPGMGAVGNVTQTFSMDNSAWLETSPHTIQGGRHALHRWTFPASAPGRSEQDSMTPIDRAARRRIATRFHTRSQRVYVAVKLATDPVYAAAASI